MVEAITSMDVDFAQWYTDVVKKAELDRLFQCKRMYGHQTGTDMQSGRISRQSLTADFKETGVENVYMPMFIPESLLQKERKIM